MLVLAFRTIAAHGRATRPAFLRSFNHRIEGSVVLRADMNGEIVDTKFPGLLDSMSAALNDEPLAVDVLGLDSVAVPAR